MTQRGQVGEQAVRVIRSGRARPLKILQSVPVQTQGFVLLDVPPHTQKQLLHQLRNSQIIKLLHYVDPDDATDLLQLLPPRRRHRIIEQLASDMKAKVEFLLKFHPRTAAGLMDLNYIEVETTATVAQVAAVLERHEKHTGKFPTILVVENGLLVGELPGHVLALAKPRDHIHHAVQHTPTVRYDLDEKRVVELFQNNPHVKVVVLDDDASILGVIYSDDIIRLLQKESADNLYDFAGVNRAEDVLDSAWQKIRLRYKWLIINLGTEFLAVSVIGGFEDTISKFVLLAVYMPMVAGMGGNAATQTLAVVVRGLALQEVELRTVWKVLTQELLAASANGLINGVLVALVAILWHHNPMLGLVIGIAMVINLFVAGLFGTLIPLLMQRLGKDPATSATIFITTATDVCGFFAFLGLASVLL